MLKLLLFFSYLAFKSVILLTRIYIKVFKPNPETNCYIYAFYRWEKKGGYIVCRNSHVGPWWHFFWSPNLKQFYNYVPFEYEHNLTKAPSEFKGHVSDHDNNS